MAINPHQADYIFFFRSDKIMSDGNLLANIPPTPPQEMVMLDNEDFSLPRWKINRLTGNFINEVTGEDKPELHAILLKVDKSRFYWPPFDSGKKFPICYSINGIVPKNPLTKYGKISKKGNRLCPGCPQEEWINGTKPNCAISYNFLLLDIDTEMPSVLNMSRSRTKVARQLNSFWRLQGVKFSLRFSTVIEKSSNIDFWQVQYEIADKIGDWMPYAHQMRDASQLLLTGTIEQSQEDLQEEVETDKPRIDPETGEVSDEIAF